MFKFCYFKLVCLFFALLIENCFAEINVNQGEIIEDDFFSKIYIGMNKQDVLKKIGTPILYPKSDFECFCYYYYYHPSKSSLSIKTRYIVMFFNNSLLISYFYRL